MEDLHFTKMEGCGNDFVVITKPAAPSLNWKAIAERLCDRHFGIGSDGLMVLDDASHPEREIRVQMFNPDGSPMGMCGNGIRCLTRYLSLQGVMSGDCFTAPFDVSGRRIICEAEDYGRMVRVNMGVPSFSPEDIPLDTSEPLISGLLTVRDFRFPCTMVSMGNPHCVIPVDCVDEIEIEKHGPAIEHHELFPKRTNVEFVEVINRSHLKVRVWERGAGITLACGTGACASLVACAHSGLSEGRAQVDLPGGSLSIEWEGEGRPVLMKGPAREVFTGIISKTYMEGLL